VHHQKVIRAKGAVRSVGVAKARVKSATMSRRFSWSRATLHEAAKMFEAHPHFTIFPGEAVEVMPLRPVPGA